MGVLLATEINLAGEIQFARWMRIYGNGEVERAVPPKRSANTHRGLLRCVSLNVISVTDMARLAVEMSESTSSTNLMMMLLW